RLTGTHEVHWTAEGGGRCAFASAISSWDFNTSSQHFGKTHSRPYLVPTSSSFCMSLYGTSAGGGIVIAGAGTLHSLKYPSSPAGVSSTSIRICSELISNECTIPRGAKITLPDAPLIFWPPTVAVISPSIM